MASTLLHQISMYEREKLFQFEQEQFLMMESLSQMAVVDLFILFEKGNIKDRDYLNYENGTVEYWVQDETDTMMYINFFVNTREQRQRFGRVGIDKENRVVVDWLEIRK